MPTLAKPQLTESRSAWGAASDEMYQKLCRNRVKILTALRFYEQRDLLPPDVNSSATKNEEEELLQIAGALAVAAEASGIMSTAVLVATLLKVSKNPSLFVKRELPAPVEWAIACDYQRGDEPPGTHWRDVWGDQVSRVPGEVEQPTEDNIKKAASAAVATIQETRTPGRTRNCADQILADRLGEIFRGSGQPIRRHRTPIMCDGASVYVEAGGPFYDWLDLVLEPLQRYLRARDLAPVTVATIVRLVTEDFPRSS